MRKPEIDDMIIQCIELFDATDGETLAELIARHPTGNVEHNVHTKRNWEIHHHPESDYKLEFARHTIGGHWRITKGTERRRVAFGFKIEGLDNLLNDRPVSFLGNRKEPGNQFSFYPNISAVDREKVVILLHGMGVRAKSMEKLARALEEEDYQVCNYDYATDTPGGDEQIAEDFLEQLKQLWLELNLDEREVYFLVHSNGGIVLRVALEKMDKTMRNHIRAIVMLGTPNQGSGWASVLSIFTTNQVVHDISLSRDSLVNNLDVLEDMPLTGIIRGRADCKVSSKRAHLPNCAEDDFVIVKGTHPGERNPKKTLKQILTFFEEGHFEH